MILYLDTSALVKNYVIEPGSTWLRQLIGDETNDIFLANLSIAEVGAALAILVRNKQIARRQGDIELDRFFADVETRFSLVDITTEIVYRAAALCQQHPLKGYDAVQLATALSLAKALQSLARSLVFICGDQQLLTAAENEGLVTDDPFDHVEPGSNP